MVVVAVNPAVVGVSFADAEARVVRAGDVAMVYRPPASDG